MRVRVDDVSFERPAGLADLTSYSYKGSSPRTEFSIECEAPVGGATAAAEVLVDRRSKFEGYFAAAFSVEEEGDVQLGGAPAKFMRYSIDDKGQPISGYIAVANLGAGDWTMLAWQVGAASDQVAAIVDPMLASFGAADAPAPKPAGPGYTRREAGDWAFDVPDGHTYPRIRIYEDPDAELRHEVEVHVLDVDARDLDDRVKIYEGRGWTLVDREDVPIPNGELLRLQFEDPLGDRWFACCSAQRHEVGNPIQNRWVEVRITGPAAITARLRAVMDATLASIAVGGGR